VLGSTTGYAVGWAGTLFAGDPIRLIRNTSHGLPL